MLVFSKSFLAGVAVASAICVPGWSQAAQQGQQAQQGQPAQGQAGQGQAAQGQGAQGQAGQGQAASGQPQKQVKDQGEYDLFTSVTKETDPNKKLGFLNQWKEKYPNTDFKKERQLFFLDTYRNLNQPDKMIQQAKEILAEDPKDVTSMFWLASIIPSLPNSGTNTEYVGLADKAGRGLLEQVPATFEPTKKPAQMSEEQWKKARNDMEAVAYKAVGWSAMINKNNEVAKENFTKALQANPGAGEVSYWLGLTIVGEKNPETYGTGLYHIARAVAYEGPGALSPQGRQQIGDSLTKMYQGFHGDNSGLDQVKATAKANALPPAGFKIASVKEVAENKLRAEEEAAKADPMGALWKRLKDELAGPNGQQYFEASMKGAQAPRLRGTVVSHTPKSVVLALSDKTTPEVTLEVDTALPGKADPGTVIEFEGVAKTFTPDPFMLTMDIERSNIHGWPAAAPSKRPASRKPARRRR